MQADTARDAAAARRDARKDGYPFRRYEVQKTWKVVTETPRFLSLSGDIYSYTGGAHGSPGSTALLWDRAVGRRIDPRSLFVSAAALQAAVGPAFCTRLKAEQRKRLGQAPAPDGIFGKCPPISDLTLLLGSSDHSKIDRVGLIADPYVAGSYAEGAYEVTLPVTPTMMRAVKPAYRGAFAIR